MSSRSATNTPSAPSESCRNPSVSGSVSVVTSRTSPAAVTNRTPDTTADRHGSWLPEPWVPVATIPATVCAEIEPTFASGERRCRARSPCSAESGVPARTHTRPAASGGDSSPWNAADDSVSNV